MLSYSVGDDSVYPNPLDDLSRAVWEVRKNADEWGINPNAIVLMGFSAGSGVTAKEGQHGMSVGNNAPGKSLDDSPNPSVDMWVPLCENWINSLFH